MAKPPSKFNTKVLQKYEDYSLITTVISILSDNVINGQNLLIVINRTIIILVRSYGFISKSRIS